MANKKGTGLLLLYVDIPANMEDHFNRWYNEEHLQERLSVPGFLNAARYVAVSGSPKYLACYELESPAVLQSEFYLKQRDNSTDWSRRMSSALALSPTTSMFGTHRTNTTTFIRNVYRQVFPAEVSPEEAQSDMAPAFQIGRMNIPPEYEDEWNDWYNTVYVPDYETVPGCISPNPPKDRDGRREDSGSGEGVTGAMIRARIWVDGRLGGGLQALLGAPMAAYSSCGEGDGGIGHGKRRSRTGLARVCGDVGLAGGSVADGRRQAGSGMARSRARARLNCSSQGQRRGRCRVNGSAERVIRPAKAKTRRLRVLVVRMC